MIRLGVDTDKGPMILIGLTDVNMKRLAEGQPARCHGRQWMPPEDTKLIDTTIVIFHATREACLEIAREFGVPEAKMLDLLGEG